MPPQYRHDAVETLYIAREFENVAARAYETKYGVQRVRELIPTDASIPQGTGVFSYKVYDRVGIAKIIAAYSTDLPRVDVKATEQLGRVRVLGASYGYSILEIEKAAQTRVGLEQRKANTARQAIEEQIASIAMNGSADFNLLGLLNQPNVTVYTIPNGASGFADWPRKTADEILADMFGIADAITAATNNVEVPDTLLIPDARFSLINRMRVDVGGDTILSFFLKNSRKIRNVDSWLNLSGAGAGGTNRMVAYRRDPDALGLAVPREFEELEPEKRNLEYVVDCIAEVGGVIVWYPLSMAYGDGV